MCLFSSLGIFSLLSSLLEEKVFILKAFLLEEESLVWGRVLVGESLVGDFLVLGGELIRALKMRGRGLLIEKTPLFTLGQTLTLIFF